ncbi:MAG: pyridoxamine 5'-phosphate oxidase family protein [Candidatus Acetothermia bacterium]|jgi:general stress protein 26|nr:pyridoxamine 5'-phosphate oxidase family protein [Candidatus Acetothermia bacterium]
MDIGKLKQVCIEVMETAPAAYLTTIGADGYPHTRAMFNLRNRGQYPNQAHLFTNHQRDLLVYFTTNTSSGKVREIRANPRVSAYYCDPCQVKGVMLCGDMEIVDNSELRRALWNEGWERYYPGGPDDLDYTVLRLVPKLAMGWYKGHRFEFRLEGA